MKSRVCVLAIAYVGYAVAHNGPHSTNCTPGAYRCHGAGGQSAAFLQCDASGSEVLKSCAPGTVCYAEGKDSILCSYPVNTANGPPPASGSLVSGAQCNVVSPFDEYMCPGPNGQHNYYLRCLSGTFIHFPCPPGTTCHKTEGQSMVCGLPAAGAGGGADAPPPSAESIATGTSGMDMSEPPTNSSPSDAMSPASSSDMDTGMGMGMGSSGMGTPSTASPETASANPPPTQSNGLTGPVISSGLEMLLNNGVQLPFTLPNIDLPAIDLATVHLPDLTFDGIALTAIPLPSVTIPPLNPASLTHFTYIESIMSQAGITFDDLAKLKLPDLSHIDMSALGHIDPAMIMSLMNVNRAPVPTNQANANDIAGSVPAASPQTTTLGTDAIDALLGLSIITFSASA
ncbi:hypothetical protein LPJ59_004602 [Coemansia sp. RSA 2399]|nr:hypothetical protein LPJ59_004602 [Coemansia sp. RSA 2399]